MVTTLRQLFVIESGFLRKNGRKLVRIFRYHGSLYLLWLFFYLQNVGLRSICENQLVTRIFGRKIYLSRKYSTFFVINTVQVSFSQTCRSKKVVAGRDWGSNPRYYKSVAEWSEVWLQLYIRQKYMFMFPIKYVGIYKMGGMVKKLKILFAHPNFENSSWKW